MSCPRWVIIGGGMQAPWRVEILVEQLDIVPNDLEIG